MNRYYTIFAKYGEGKMCLQRNLLLVVVLSIIIILFHSYSLAGPFTFQIIQGDGIEVCKAYHTAIQNMNWNASPECGRGPLEAKGFEKLTRRYLTADEIYPLYDQIMYFKHYGDQDFRDYITDPFTKEKKEKLFFSDTKESPMQTLRNRPLLKPWQYSESIDINNDGKPDNVIIWYEGPCEPRRPTREVYILNSTKSRLDENYMHQVLEHHDKKWPYESKHFRFIDEHMDVFQYKGQVYIDAFPMGWDTSNENRHEEDIRIYLHIKGKTKMLCSYHWIERN